MLGIQNPAIMNKITSVKELRASGSLQELLGFFHNNVDHEDALIVVMDHVNGLQTIGAYKDLIRPLGAL